MDTRVLRKRANYLKKRSRVKHTLRIGSAPRLCVFRSNKNIYVQLIDDLKGNTIVSSSTLEKNIAEQLTGKETKKEKSAVVGKAIGKAIVEKNIEKIIFDRNGYKYHGRIKALADAVREAGVKF